MHPSPAHPLQNESSQPTVVDTRGPNEPVQAAAGSPPRFQVSRSLRVLHVINGEHYSGAERVQDLLAEGLPACRVEVQFACLKPGRFSTDRRCQATPLHRVEMRSRFDLTAAWRLARLAKREQIDILHAHTPRAAMVTALAAPLCQKPWVFHVHSPTSQDSTRRALNSINHWIEQQAIQRAACLIGVSQSLCQHMLDHGVAENRVVRVANGVPRQERLARQRLPNQDRWTLGTVALFRPRKGTEVLLEAVQMLREAGHDVRLRAVGGFETSAYEQLLHCQVESLGIEEAVEWIGYTRSVAEEMAQFDAFVLPSHFGEGMPMVVLEAMALGIPVVATKVEGVPEVLEHGTSGLLAEPGSSTNLAQQIQRLFVEPHLLEELSDNGYQRQQTHFSDHSMADGVAEVYQQLLQLGLVR